MHRIAIVILVVVAACGGSKPDRAKAQAACDHSVELGFMESAAAKGSDADAKAMLAEMKKGPIWKEQVDQCTDAAMKDSSASQVDCILAAKTGSDIDKCK